MEFGPGNKENSEPVKSSAQNNTPQIVPAHPERQVNSNPIHINWEGPQLVCHSLALVNREICNGLIESKECEISLIPHEDEQKQFFNHDKRHERLTQYYNKSLEKSAEFHIRHQWPPNFSPPADGRWILIQPWEFGYLPKEWIKPVQEQIDEVWVYSKAVYKCYVDSGISEDKVHLIPLGINPSIFNPDASHIPLTTKKKFKFLFVGGTIWRKGIDILLDAYVKAFRSNDDVCLVIKDMGGDSFYQGMTAKQQIEEIQKDSCSPEILHLENTLSESELPGLYTACDCLVHPYRGEGFGLPVAEAMACNLPVIVTKGGSTDDFCAPDNSFQIAAKRIPVTIETPLIKQGWVLNPDIQHLVSLMMNIFKNPVSGNKRAARAAEFIRENYTWDHTVKSVLTRLRGLRSAEISIPRTSFTDVPPSIPKDTQDGRIAAAAKPTNGKSESNIDDIIKLGNEHFKNNNYDEALSFFIKAHNKNPGDIEIAIKCAEISVRQDDSHSAVNYLKNCIAADPNNPDAYNCLGVFQVHRENHEEAVKAFRRALSVAPGDTTALKNLAELCFQLKNFEEAISLGEKLLENDTQDIDTQLLVGNSYAFAGKLPEAKAHYEKILTIDPDNKDALENCRIVDDALDKDDK